jgi:hypothetical protein
MREVPHLHYLSLLHEMAWFAYLFGFNGLSTIPSGTDQVSSIKKIYSITLGGERE